MKTTMIVVTAFCAVTAAVGETNAQRRVRTPEEHEAFVQRARLKRTGGTIRQPGSAKGAFVILNAQKRVGEAAITPDMSVTKEYFDIEYSVRSDGGVTVANVGRKIRDAGGTVGVALVDDPTLPSLLTAPETRWSIVNVALLAENCPDDATLASRVRKEILRSLAFTAGGVYATRGDPLMRDVTKPSDLDGLKAEVFGLETINRFIDSAPLYGLKPWHVTTYREACEQGWAPQPTNEYQKRVWDKVHAIPTKPLKIEYNEKRDKGK